MDLDQVFSDVWFLTGFSMELDQKVFRLVRIKFGLDYWIV